MICAVAIGIARAGFCWPTRGYFHPFQGVYPARIVLFASCLPDRGIESEGLVEGLDLDVKLAPAENAVVRLVHFGYQGSILDSGGVNVHSMLIVHVNEAKRETLTSGRRPAIQNRILCLGRRGVGESLLIECGSSRL